MQIKEIRKKTNLTQKEFAVQYNIPLQTLKQWESSTDSTSYREPSVYVVDMLKRLVSEDYEVKFGRAKSREEYLIDAAQRSKYNLRQWLRYLRKEVDDSKRKITPKELKNLMNSDELTMCQKIVLNEALTNGTRTNVFVSQLNKPAKPKMVEELKKHNGK